MSNLFAVLIVAMVTVTELKTILKNEGVVGYSKLRKAELEALVERVQNEKAKDKKKKKKTYVEDFDSRQLVTKSKPKKSVKQADVPEDYHKLHSQFDLSKFDAEKAKQYYKDEKPIVERTLSPEEYEKYFGIKIPIQKKDESPHSRYMGMLKDKSEVRDMIYAKPQKPKVRQNVNALIGMINEYDVTYQDISVLPDRVINLIINIFTNLNELEDDIKNQLHRVSEIGFDDYEKLDDLNEIVDNLPTKDDLEKVIATSNPDDIMEDLHNFAENLLDTEIDEYFYNVHDTYNKLFLSTAIDYDSVRELAKLTAQPKPKKQQKKSNKNFKSNIKQLEAMRKKHRHMHQHNKMLFEQAERKLQREVKKKNQQKVLARKLPVKQIAPKHDAATTEYLNQLNKVEKLLHENKLPAVTSDPYKRATQHAINTLRNITNQPSYNSTWLPNYIKHTHFFTTFSDILDVNKIMELVPWYKASQTTQSSIQHSKPPQSSILRPTLPKHLTHKKHKQQTKATKLNSKIKPISIKYKGQTKIVEYPNGKMVIKKIPAHWNNEY